jgi:hypothetical protein
MLMESNAISAVKESAIEQDVDQAFAKCYDTIDDRKAVLKQMLSDISGKKKSDLESQLDELSAKKASLDQAINFSEDHLTYSNSVLFSHGYIKRLNPSIWNKSSR